MAAEAQRLKVKAWNCSGSEKAKAGDHCTVALKGIL
jgi:hypothetical protein